MKKRSVEVVSISLEPVLLLRARVRALEAGYRFSFSAWVANLIRKEIQCHEPIVDNPSV